MPRWRQGDSTVDRADQYTYLDAFTASHPLADVNGDGVVDAADFVAFEQNYASEHP